MTNWKEYKLSDLMQIKYGKDHKHLADGSYPLYGSGGIMRYVEKPLYEEESILIPRKGTLSNLFYLNEPFWSVDTMFYSQINKELALPKYLYYTLKTFDLASLNVGSAVPSLTTQVLNEVLVSVPDLPTQTAIAEILSSLDDKIELNNKINQELENLAQTLFKQWFIDFEFPNEKGEPYKSSGGEMVDSELGKIPKGWKVDLLNTIFDFLEGPGLRNWQYTKEGMPFINIRLIQNGDINIEKSSFISKQEFETKYKHFELHEFDFIVSTSGTLGKSAIVRKSHLPLMLNTSVIRFKPLKPNSKCYMYQYLQSESFLDELTTQASGSVQLNFGPMHLNRINMIIPNDSIIENYEEIVNNVYEKIISNREENNYLSNLRDTLLPKLISGELEVSDIQSNTL